MLSQAVTTSTTAVFPPPGINYLGAPPTVPVTVPGTPTTTIPTSLTAVSPVTPSGSLPFTGSNTTLPLAQIAVALIVIGFFLVFIYRQRMARAS
jgi:hypothetical protein